jgi:hypothetical protein
MSSVRLRGAHAAISRRPPNALYTIVARTERKCGLSSFKGHAALSPLTTPNRPHDCSLYQW